MDEAIRQAIGRADTALVAGEHLASIAESLFALVKLMDRLTTTGKAMDVVALVERQ